MVTAALRTGAAEKLGAGGGREQERRGREHRDYGRREFAAGWLHVTASGWQRVVLPHTSKMTVTR
jgi:hypothetical protein